MLKTNNTLTSLDVISVEEGENGKEKEINEE